MRWHAPVAILFSVTPRAMGIALAESLFRQLQSGFSQEACYWQESGYNDPSHPFFSFLYDMVEASSRRRVFP